MVRWIESAPLMKTRTAVALLLAVALLWAGFADTEAEAPLATSVAAALHVDASEAFADLQAIPSADAPVRVSAMAATNPAPVVQAWRVDPYLGALRRPPRAAAYSA
jgi:hypothetical protein